MNMYGRISVCGAITGYNDTSPSLLPALQPTMVAFQLKMEGFFVWRLDKRLIAWLPRVVSQVVAPRVVARRSGENESFVGKWSNKK